MVPMNPDPLPVVKAGPIDVPDLCRPIGWNPELTPAQKSHIEGYLRGRNGALAALPMICRWEECIIRAQCPLYQAKVDPPPRDLPCPIETSDIDRWVKELMVELEVTEKDVTDLSILRELVTWMVLEKRALAELALDPKNIRDAVLGIDKDGDPITKEMMNPAITMLEKAAKTKQKYRDALVATREAKAKDKGRKQPSMSEFAATIMQKIEAKKRGLQAVLPPVIDATPVAPPKALEAPPAGEAEPELPDAAEIDFG